MVLSFVDQLIMLHVRLRYVNFTPDRFHSRGELYSKPLPNFLVS